MNCSAVIRLISARASPSDTAGCRVAAVGLPPLHRIASARRQKSHASPICSSGLCRARNWTAWPATSFGPPTSPPEILARLGVPPPSARGDDSISGALLDRVQRWDLEGSLAEGLLTKADRASMSSALELRAPFLDEAVMAFAATLPADGTCARFCHQGFLETLRLALPAQIHRVSPQTRSVRARRPLAARPAAGLGGGRAGQPAL